MKHFKYTTLRHKVIKRKVDERTMLKPTNILRILKNRPIILQENLQILKKLKYPSKKKTQKLTKVKEENTYVAISPPPIYRGSGVKYHIGALLELGKNVERTQRVFRQWKTPSEEPQNDRYKKPIKDSRKIKYIDMEQKKETQVTTTINEVEYPIPCPPPQDRPPDYQYKKSKTTDKEQILEDWGRETTLLSLRYIDRPPFEPPNQYRLQKKGKKQKLCIC